MKTKGDKSYKQISYAIFSAVIYTIWTVRNSTIFKAKHRTVCDMLKDIKQYIVHRILYLHTFTKKFGKYIDRILK